MSMHPPAPTSGNPGDPTFSPSRRPAPWWRRGLVWGLRAFAVSLLIASGIYAVYRWNAESVRLEALRALDERDRGWRWEAIQASRATVSDDKNAIHEVRRLVALLPRGWPNREAIQRIEQSTTAPNWQFTADQRKALDVLLAGNEGHALRTSARELIRWPQCRTESVWNPRDDDTELSSDHDHLRSIGVFLWFDLLDAIDRHEPESVLASLRALRHVANMLREDPSPGAQSLRLGLHARVRLAVERWLGHALLRDDELAALGSVLERPKTRPTADLSIRAERWFVYQRTEQIITGAIRLGELPQGQGRDAFWDLSETVMAEKARFTQPAALDLAERLITIAELPIPQQFEAEGSFQHDRQRLLGSLRSVVRPRFEQHNNAARRNICAGTATHALIAVERYRLRHGKWPAKLDDCVPAYLDSAPLDPIDEAPLRYKILPDGVVVYSIGNDRKDDGGDTTATPPRDFGYRLWNTDKRGIAPPPPPDPVPMPGVEP